MGNIMYYHQALQQPDAKQFANAVIKEVNGDMSTTITKNLSSKRMPQKTRKLYLGMVHAAQVQPHHQRDHQAQGQIEHGGKQVFGMNYFETYAPVVTWFVIRLMIVMGIIFNWALRQVDFVMAYPQAPIETDIYMELPSDCNWQLQGPRAQAPESMELISCGQAHLIGLHCFINR